VGEIGSAQPLRPLRLMFTKILFTAEAQRTQRLRREECQLGFYSPPARLPDPGPFRIIHSLLEGTGSRPVGFAPTFSFVREPSEGGNGKRID